MDMFNQLLKLYESKDFDGLLNFCNAELEKDSINYLLLGAKGRALFELEKYEEAIKFTTDAIQINKEYVAGYFNRGLCYYFTDNFEFAILDLEKSLQLGNTSYEIYFYIGGSYYFKNEFEKSIEFFSIYLDNCEDENETILNAIRIFNLRMLNSIGKEEKFRRSTSHCLDLSDAIILKTQE